MPACLNQFNERVFRREAVSRVFDLIDRNTLRESHLAELTDGQALDVFSYSVCGHGQRTWRTYTDVNLVLLLVIGGQRLSSR